MKRELKKKKRESSVIKSWYYDFHEGKLFVRFHSGNLYEFNNVPLRVFIGLLRADSHGKYFNNKIRRRYNYKKIKSIKVLI